MFNCVRRLIGWNGNLLFIGNHLLLLMVIVVHLCALGELAIGRWRRTFAVVIVRAAGRTDDAICGKLHILGSLVALLHFVETITSANHREDCHRADTGNDCYGI